LSWLRLATPILAPAAAKDSAMPRLMPLVPPKTKTFLPLKSKREVQHVLSCARLGESLDRAVFTPTSGRESASLPATPGFPLPRAVPSIGTRSAREASMRLQDQSCS
jgi:hypothetical protein